MDKICVIEAAKRLGISKSWLNKKRVTGGGPPYIKLGRRVVYDVCELEVWAEGRKRTNTSVTSSSM